jgi:hypothetical protein
MDKVFVSYRLPKGDLDTIAKITELVVWPQDRFMTTE